MSSAVPARVLWWDDEDRRQHAASGGAPAVDVRDADVVIVGAGYTGLWTAYHLLCTQPDLRVVVFEARRVGVGASGRNGGWCTPELPLSLDSVDGRHGPGAAFRWRSALVDTVGQIANVIVREGIDAHWAQGGWLQLARNGAQAERLRRSVDMYRRHGFGEDACRWMEPDEVATMVRATRIHGGTFSAQTAALHPARLVDGLADAVRRRGGSIVEHCPVTEVMPGGVIAAGRRVAARWVMGATEGYGGWFPGAQRRLVPVYSMMIATEPLDAACWEELGLRDREVFNDARHTVIYGQRTADGRLAFGGRGAPYHLGSRISDRFDSHAGTRRHLRHTLIDLFPQLAGVDVTHHWGGPLGVPRDWHPGVGVDVNRRWAWAGGYVGEGVAASALAGRTLADLITDRAEARTRLAWVGHGSRRWEPEPWRWLGINAMVQIARFADHQEGRERPTPRLVTALLERLTGH